MSMFYCNRCDLLADSDDGCIEWPTREQPNGLACDACATEVEELEEFRQRIEAPFPEGAAS